MVRWAELVLHHRRWVIGFWFVVMVAGGAMAGTVSNRLTVDFDLPGQPGTEAANKIVQTYCNGGKTTPLASVALPGVRRVSACREPLQRLDRRHEVLLDPRASLVEGG